MSKLLLGILLAVAAQAEWEGVGKIKIGKLAGTEIRFHNKEVVAAISVLAPNIVRVRIARGRSFAPDHSWAVAKTEWPETEIRFIKEKSRVLIRTSALEIRVQLKPFLVAFYDPDGRLISKDARQPAWDGQRVRCWKSSLPGERYYGLGEKTGPLEKNGKSYVLWNTDPAGYDAGTDSMYQSVPFFIALRDGKSYGLFFDNTYRSSFDMGAESPDYYSFGAEGGELNYYFFGGPSPKDVIRQYTELTGRVELPPLWALGYIQSSMNYAPESKVRFIAENFRQRNIPCDAIFLDNIHMREHRVFTWDKSRFPEPSKMISDLRRQGFRIIAITDPGIKVEKDYRVYEQGLAGDHFLRKQNGQIYTGIMWPGISAFPDFTSEKTREWWGSLFWGSVRDGVSGFLTDMNEPTVSAIPLNKGWIPVSLDADVVFNDRGLWSSYAKNHNVYGMLMSWATRDGLLHSRQDERPFVITRATYAGGQRYAAQWTGDNLATWEDLRAGLRTILSMGLSGMSFTGSDTGGFIGMPTPELYARWLELGIFNPFFWTHSASAGGLEPWTFGVYWENINRKTIELRYRLLPYLYNAFYESTQTGLPIVRALLIDYPDDAKAMAATPDKQNNEFLFGGDLLAAPVVREGEMERLVYLPKGIWYDFWTDKRYAGPADIKADAPIGRIPIFVREGAIIPTRQVVEYTGQASIDPLIFEVYPNGGSSREYYEDDGISFDYRKERYLKRRISIGRNGNGIHLDISATEGKYVPPPRYLLLKIHGQELPPQGVLVNGAAAEQTGYDSQTKICWVKTPDTNNHIIIDVK